MEYVDKALAFVWLKLQSLEVVLLWARQPENLLIISVCLIVLTWLVLRLIRTSGRKPFTLKIRDPRMAHRWQSTEYVDKPTYCNACNELCVSGSCCESCGLCICTQPQCLKMASTAQTCKPLSATGSNQDRSHFWVRGNLPICSLCFRCLTPCGNRPRLADYRCVWCHKTAHEDCVVEIEENEEECSMGPHQSMLIPPSSVTLNLEGWRGRRRLVVKRIVPPAVSDWRPLVVLANPRSGGNDGPKILSTFRKLLNPIQVVDVSETPPETGLEICRLLPHHNCRLLVCGGDGTVGWVLSALDKCQLPNPPHVAILPLGTGNDLARVLGWGKGYDDEDINDILKDVKHAQLSMLDRWRVKIEHKRLTRYLGLNKGTKDLMMNNYLGVGCDAGVALNFHRQRESRPALFQSRFINKAWYLGFGARDVLEQSCKNLPQKIEVFLDGVPQKLPDLEGVVVLNINSWSAGCCMWSDSRKDNCTPSRMDDQLLEVVGLYSSLHVGKIQVSLGQPLRMGQAKEIKIVIHESVPVQVDGEPWQQGPATITVSHYGQAHMLKKIKLD